MTDDDLEPHVVASAELARQAVLTFYLNHAGIDWRISTKQAIREFENKAGYEGELDIQIWQLLLCIDDMRVQDRRSWESVFASGDASRELDVRNLVRALHGLCNEEGIDFDEQLRTIALDIHTLRPGREADWPDIAPRPAPRA